MKKAIAIMVSVLFVFTVTLVSFPIGVKGATAVTKKKTTGQKKLKRVTGQVTAVDLDKKTFIVEGIPIYIVKGTTTKAAEKILADIRVGDRVTVEYITKGMNTAVTISKGD